MDPYRPPPSRAHWVTRRPVRTRSGRPSYVPGIVMLVLGSLGVVLAGFVAAVPLLVFAAAGGGVVPDWYDGFAAQFPPVALDILLGSVTVLVIGVVLAAWTGWRRRERR